jgi:hypothetical protein
LKEKARRAGKMWLLIACYRSSFPTFCYQNRATGLADDLLGNASHDKACETSAAMAPENQEVGSPGLSRLDEGLARSTPHE